MHVTEQHIQLVSPSQQSVLNPHLFFCAPIPVSPGSDWWSSAVPLVKHKEKKKDKSFLQHTVSWAIKDDWTFHVSIWKMKNRQIASAPFYWNLTGKGQLVWNALWNFTQPDTDMQAFSIYTLLTNHLESVNSSTVCSMRPWVQHLKP